MTERENIFIRILKRLGIITEFEVSKEDMCKQAQSICNHDCEHCALGDGLENVCRSVLRKAHYASHQTEEKPRTIINLDAYEITALIWAMNEYIHNGQFAERI